jgi:hypothetical protein
VDRLAAKAPGVTVEEEDEEEPEEGVAGARTGEGLEAAAVVAVSDTRTHPYHKLARIYPCHSPPLRT